MPDLPLPLLPTPDELANLLRGRGAISPLFRCLAHRRLPPPHLHLVPHDARAPTAVDAMRKLFIAYRRVRRFLQYPHVLSNDRGVLWQNDEDIPILFTFCPTTCRQPCQDALDDTYITEGSLHPWHIYYYEQVTALV